jgi:hypothetical protein
MENTHFGLRSLVLATAPAGVWFAGIAALHMVLGGGDALGPYPNILVLVTIAVAHLWLPLVTLVFVLTGRPAALPLILATLLAEGLAAVVLLFNQ